MVGGGKKEGSGASSCDLYDVGLDATAPPLSRPPRYFPFLEV